MTAVEKDAIHMRNVVMGKKDVKPVMIAKQAWNV
jgi:hypothetical protein